MVGMTLFLAFSPGRSSPGDPFDDCCALALMWVAALPTWQFFVSRRRTTPFFAAISALYGTYYGLPRFSDRPLFGIEKWEPPAESVRPALVIALVGVILLFVGFHIAGPFLRRVPRMTRAIDLKRALPMFVATCSVSLLLRLATARLEVPKTLEQPLVLAQAIGEMCMAGLLLAHLRGLLARWQQLFLAALIAVQVLSGILTGLLANGLWPLLSIFFAYAWERRRLPFGIILATVIVFVPMNAAKHEFRELYGVQASEMTGQTVFRRADGFALAVRHTMEQMSVREMLAVSSGRLGLLATMAVVVYQTPARVPYWDGYTYEDVLWHSIPRLLVPSKPAISFGQEFPRRYGLVDYENVDTAFNFPQMVEWYANFGVVGVVFGMMFFGCLYRVLDYSFTLNTGGILIAATVYSHLLNIETDFADVFGGMPILISLLYVFVRVLPSETADSAPLQAPDLAVPSAPLRYP
jgi:hypothetical protein